MVKYLALPDEFVAETILWRLPVKSIMQCRCVCKSWNSLITSPNFITTHLRRKTLTTKNPQIFLYHKEYIDNFGRCLLLFDGQDYLQSMLFHLPHSHLFGPDIRIVRSVNGLICFSIANHFNRIVELILCNPSIGHFQSIPQPHSELIDWTVKGFGFDESALDFKILLFSSSIGFIYSLNSNSWRTITCSFPENWTMLCDSVPFVNGRFHWLAYYHPRNLIVVFDVKSEAFGHIPLPESLENPRLGAYGLTEFGESSIAIYEKCGSHLWIMKEYGSAESWTKLTVTEKSLACVLGFRSKDEVLIKLNDGCIASQKINNKKSEKVKKLTDAYDHDSRRLSAHRYVPSLVLLDKQNNADVAAPIYAIVSRAAPTRKKRIRSNSQSLLL